MQGGISGGRWLCHDLFSLLLYILASVSQICLLPSFPILPSSPRLLSSLKFQALLGPFFRRSANTSTKIDAISFLRRAFICQCSLSSAETTMAPPFDEDLL